jgi:hypothetical protein
MGVERSVRPLLRRFCAGSSLSFSGTEDACLIGAKSM